MATISRPSSASSWARIEPVQPKPTITTSFGGNFLAMPPPVPTSAKASGVRRRLFRPVRVLGDSNRRQRVALVVPLAPPPVIVARPREPDHLPRRHVFVAAIDRIGEETLLRVLEKKIEEALGAFDLERTVFKSGNDLVLTRIGKLSERGPAKRRATMPVEARQCLPIMLRRRHRRLRALLAGAIVKRPAHVEAIKVAVGPGELTINEDGAPDVFSARGFRIGRNEPIDQGFDGSPFLRGEIMPT